MIHIILWFFDVDRDGKMKMTHGPSEFLDSQFENEEGRGRRKSLVSVKSIQRRIVGIRKDESSENHFNSNRHLVAVDHDLLASQSLTDVGDRALFHLLRYLYQMRLLEFSKVKSSMGASTKYYGFEVLSS